MGPPLVVEPIKLHKYMDNLKSPASPQMTYGLYGEGPEISYQETDREMRGFTKLELASLMIAQGLSQWNGGQNASNRDFISAESVRIAKAVLEEANK